VPRKAESKRLCVSFSTWFFNVANIPSRLKNKLLELYVKHHSHEERVTRDYLMAAYILKEFTDRFPHEFSDGFLAKTADAIEAPDNVYNKG
jgi:ABC-type oligopeptide transport system ATPase subunit